jgi:hypothetical protein
VRSPLFGDNFREPNQAVLGRDIRRFEH